MPSWEEFDWRKRAEEAVNSEIDGLNPVPPKYRMKTLDEYEEKDIEWLIQGYIPKGQITILCGDGGSGKTSVWTSLIASLTTGRPTLFDGITGEWAMPKREPQKCMFFSSEDTIEHVIKPKLRAEKANMKNILSMSLDEDNFDSILIGSDEFEGRIKYYKPVLCVIDPLQSFIPKKVEMSKRNEVRQTMKSLITWGKKYGTSFLIVMHTNKMQNVWGRARMADSADLWDIARSVLIFGNATNDRNGQKYISHEKCNYGQTGQTLLFSNTTGCPTFDSWTDKTDRDFVLEKAKAKKAESAANEVGECAGVILTELGNKPEGMLIKDLDSILADIGGYKDWTIRQAKRNLLSAGFIDKSKQGMGGNWILFRTGKQKK